MPEPPPCPFGAEWNSLRLRDMRRFFGARPPERAIWEAKQHDAKPQLAKFIRREVCAFANRRGGYLVLGAEEAQDGWVLSGVEVTGVREMHDWIASLLLDLAPPPLFDVQEWGLPNRRKLVVIQVEPADLRPTSWNGVVYLRHGTQTRRADGPAIRRLAAEGGRAEGRLAKAARALAVSFADQLWSPFGLALAHPGNRPYQLADPQPERIAYEELERGLQKRWPARKHHEMVWGSANEDKAKDLGFQGKRIRGGWQHSPPAHRGWRAAWEVRQEATRDSLRPPRRWHHQPKRDRRVGGRDIWIAYVYPDNSSAGSLTALPIRQHAFETEYGDRAISNAALLLDVLLSIERRLGARPHEPLFVTLALRDLTQAAPVVIERVVDTSLRPATWRRDVTEEAGRMMRLTY